MAHEADNFHNPELNLSQLEFANEAHIRSAYVQLASLYEKAQDPLFACSVPGFSVSFDKDRVARYRFDYGRRSPDEYHSLDIQENAGVIALHQEHAEPLETGSRIATREVVVSREGRAHASVQRVGELSKGGIFSRAGIVDDSDSTVVYDGKVPAGYLNDLQLFIDKVWESTNTSVLGKIITS